MPVGFKYRAVAQTGSAFPWGGRGRRFKSSQPDFRSKKFQYLLEFLATAVFFMFLLIFSVSFVATLLSSMSGAGSAMVTVPTWLILGYPLPIAQAASKINGALWTPIAARNYLASLPLDLPLLCGLVLCGMLGAYFGVTVVVELDSQILQRIIGVLILCLVLYSFFQKKFGIETSAASSNKILTSFLALPLGFYEGFFGSGNGIFASVLLVKTRGFNLTTALGYYYIISFAWCTFSAGILLRLGFADWDLIIPSSLGGLVGAYCGSRIGSKKGSAFVKCVFVLVGGVLGLKLALGL